MTLAKRLDALERRTAGGPARRRAVRRLDWRPMYERLTPDERADLDALLVRCQPMPENPDDLAAFDHVSDDDVELMLHYARKAEAVAREVGEEP